MTKTATAGTHIMTLSGSRREVLASLRNVAVTGVEFKIVTSDLRLFGTSTAIVELVVPAGMELKIG